MFQFFSKSFKFSYSTGCVVVFHCYSLDCLNDWWHWTYFHVLIFSFAYFLWSFLIFCSFFSCLFWIVRVLYLCWIYVFCQFYILWCYLPVCCLPFCFFNIVFWSAKVLNFKSSVSVVPFMVYDFCVLSKSLLPSVKSKIFLYISSRCFIVFSWVDNWSFHVRFCILCVVRVEDFSSPP